MKLHKILKTKIDNKEFVKSKLKDSFFFLYIAREFQDNDDDDLDPIFDSPFIKKPNQPKVRHASDNTTPLPERKFSFISSAPKESDKDPDESPIHNASKALDKFMKFDQKYSSFKSLKKPDSFEDTEEDSEPITG